ncbi:hypothetical protein FC07_GL002174 [Loigolactobacillus bifermentans DSM 20003]|uniref:Uncharacterized protein n=1 Tax=Loigolactobacillus bifermentans DSM 20003 TaxID=1423726 RepID=A0A0R1H8H0_9LACO|nr:hypothetical protein FC07_GL002174 [Loigolactobacillus bifermentans DSM 20003]
MIPKDHPRWCGEYHHLLGYGGHLLGSSPLVRGIHQRAREFRYYQGIIPAGAGNTK